MQRFLLLPFILVYGWAHAHSLPACQAQLIFNSQQVVMKFKSPYELLELASKKKIDFQSSQSIDDLRNYLLEHISVTDSLSRKWTISIGKVFTQSSQDAAIGNYQEIASEIFLEPSNPASIRDFTLHCDLIIHQIPNQSILFSVEDWQNGVSNNQIGVLSVDIPTGKIFPLKIKLNHGSWTIGFKNMFVLGMQHIKEGTDHLLFIITLLLPACLLVENKKWTKYGGIGRSVVKFLKIITAFTIGHSVTLLIGVLGWISIPSQLIEVIIAVSILISAIHVIRPLFYNRETFIAMGFGLIHGLAFSQTLQEFDLDYQQLLLSVLAFNLGIEAMQLIIIALIIPWFIVLSRTTLFTYLKNTLATFVGIVSIGWILQRVTGQDNFINITTDKLFPFAPILIAGVIIFTLASIYFVKVRNNLRTPLNEG